MLEVYQVFVSLHWSKPRMTSKSNVKNLMAGFIK